jgi:hypothetical protein
MSATYRDRAGATRAKAEPAQAYPIFETRPQGFKVIR